METIYSDIYEEWAERCSSCMDLIIFGPNAWTPEQTIPPMDI